MTKKIDIFSPCQRIHRLVLPLDAEKIIHHEFIGGAYVLAKTLWMLLNNTDEALAREKDVSGAAIQKPSPKAIAARGFLHGLGSYKDAEGKKAGAFPDRFIQITRCEPTPDQRKEEKPGTKFLRIKRTEDADHFEESVQYAPFSITSTQGLRHVVVVGGKDHPVQWEKKLTDSSICYLTPKSFELAKAHLKIARAKYPLCTVICQMDISALARFFPILLDTSYERMVGDICRAETFAWDTAPQKGAGKGEKIRFIDYLKDWSGTADEKKRDASMPSDPALQDRKGFDYFIVRIGNAACLVLSRDAKQKVSGTVYFHPKRCAPTRYPGLGDMLSYDFLLTAAMVHHINLDKDRNLAEAINKGAQTGVQATFDCFQEGFGRCKEDQLVKREDLSDKACAEVLFCRFLAKARERLLAKNKKELEKHVRWCQVDFNKASSANVFWRMALSRIMSGSSISNSGAPLENEERKPREACKDVALEYLTNPETYLPLVKIGKLALVDRLEVEDYLFLQNLLLDYHSDRERKRPLSIGVFGQPGAGKGFGVKQLVAEMSGGGGTFAKDDITVNLSQLKSLSELTEAFHHIRDACLSGPVPLVFFDEFDSAFENRAFGWLKYFLAPMQDGEFMENGQRYHFGKAIFVFAGGVNHSFAEFNERSRNPDFCDAKGPDFTSRLRGNLNIRSMNRPEGDEKEIEHIYMLRRAVFLRDQLEKKIGKGNSLIARSLAEALLEIPRFKHGVRSMEAILDMSRIQHGDIFQKGDLPPREQLDMHVDARAFLDLTGTSSSKEA